MRERKRLEKWELEDVTFLRQKFQVGEGPYRHSKFIIEKKTAAFSRPSVTILSVLSLKDKINTWK